MFEFTATDHTEAFGKSHQQVFGIAYIFRKTWLSSSLEVEKVVQPGEGKAYGTHSGTFQYQKGLQESWSRTLNKGLQRVMALN